MAMPLFFASGAQINALAPPELPVGTVTSR